MIEDARLPSKDIFEPTTNSKAGAEFNSMAWTVADAGKTEKTNTTEAKPDNLKPDNLKPAGTESLGEFVSTEILSTGNVLDTYTNRKVLHMEDKTDLVLFNDASWRLEKDGLQVNHDKAYFSPLIGQEVRVVPFGPYDENKLPTISVVSAPDGSKMLLPRDNNGTKVVFHKGALVMVRKGEISEQMPENIKDVEQK